MKNKRIINQWTRRFALAGVSLMGLPLFAQDVESLDSGVSTPAPVDQQAADKTARLPVTVSAGVSEQFNSDIDSGGSFSITRFKVGAGVPVRLNDDFVLGTTFRYALDSYSFQSIPSPWHNINTVAASSILSWRLDDVWTVYGGGFLKMAAESDASSLGDGVTGGGIIGFNYKVDDTLSLGAGIAIMSMLEDDAVVLPLITGKWKFADNWRLDVGLTDVATFGYGADIKWFFDKDFEFNMGAQFHKSRFRVHAADGVGQEQATTIFVGSTWHASSAVDVNGFIGVAAGGQLRAEDNNGKKLYESDYKAAPIVGLNASVKF